MGDRFNKHKCFIDLAGETAKLNKTQWNNGIYCSIVKLSDYKYCFEFDTKPVQIALIVCEFMMVVSFIFLCLISCSKSFRISSRCVALQC